MKLLTETQSAVRASIIRVAFAKAESMQDPNFKFHLKNDLGLNKQTIKNSVYYDAGCLSEGEKIERGFDVVEELLSRRTQYYTLSECSVLAQNYLCAHDNCVLDHGTDEFAFINVLQAEKKESTMNTAAAILRNFKTNAATDNKVANFVFCLQTELNLYNKKMFEVGRAGSHIWVHDKTTGTRAAIITGI